MDFGQNKIIVMALLCGCDYCPEGIGGIGRDAVLKLFHKYSNKEVLDRVRSWRYENDKYTALEMRVDDKTICSNCGHIGRTQSHTKRGCGVCRTNHGCDETLWRDERLSLKAELMIRKKALIDPTFPSEDIVNEFLTEPSTVPNLTLNWNQPNAIKFIKKISHLLEWTEIYAFRKFLPILTRWQVSNAHLQTGSVAYVVPKEIIKKRTLRSVVSLELLWEDEQGYFKGLIPDDQLSELENDPKGLQVLWSTVEPLSMLETAYPEMVNAFLKSKEKPKKLTKRKAKVPNVLPLSSLENLKDLIKATNETAETLKQKRAPKKNKGLQTITKFLKQNDENAPEKKRTVPKNGNALHYIKQCSTPITKGLPSDWESDGDDAPTDMSAIVNDICQKSAIPEITKHAGRLLFYEPISNNLSKLLSECSWDDVDLLTQKRNLSHSNVSSNNSKLKRMTMDDSFDMLVNKKPHKLNDLMERAQQLTDSKSVTNLHVQRFKERNRLSNAAPKTPELKSIEITEEQNISYFFNQNKGEESDIFEQVMELSLVRKSSGESSDDDLILISDDDSL